MSTEIIPRQSFDMEAMRAFLIALREEVGAHTALGHRRSNLVEQIKNYYLSDSEFQRNNLQYLIAQSVFDIKALRANRQLQRRAPASLLLEFRSGGIPQ